MKTRLFGSTSEIRHNQFPGQLDLFHLQTEDEPEPVPLEVESNEVHGEGFHPLVIGQKKPGRTMTDT